MIEELPPELRALISSERVRAPRPELRAAVRTRLAGSVASAATGIAGVKILLLVALVGGAGAGLATMARGHAEIAAAPTLAPPPIGEPAPAAAVEIVAREAAPPAPVAPRAPVHVAALAEPALPSDAALLAAAVRALAAHDGAHALDLVDQVAARFPSSQLAEERDAIRVRALVATGRTDEARALAARFDVEHPSSIHRHLVDHLQETP